MKQFDVDTVQVILDSDLNDLQKLKMAETYFSKRLMAEENLDGDELTSLNESLINTVKGAVNLPIGEW